MIKCKQAYFKKVEELERIEANNQQVTIKIQPDEDELTVSIPVLSTFRSLKMISLDDGAASDMSTERKLKIRTSPIWSRRESIHHPCSASRSDSNTLEIPTSRSQDNSNNNTPKRSGTRSKSKFASPLLQKHKSSESPLNKLVKGIPDSFPETRGSIPLNLKNGIQAMTNIVFKFENTNKLKLFAEGLNFYLEILINF